MRPLKLKFKNLRSYRALREVDFTGRDLVAVIGDTGAGKSSLLEAVCFALYGRCTWDSRSAQGLIADGGDGTLAVELTFRVRDETWRVKRTTSVNNSPPSTHHLESLDDGTTVFDRAGEVNAKITSLVGLDLDTFLKAVLLPQGKFQELLHTKRSDRTAVLKSILGLDRVDEVRDQSAAAVNRLAPQLERLKGRRSALPADIDHDIADAERRLHDAQQERARLEEVEADIAGLRDTEEEALRQASDLRTAARRIDKVPEHVVERFSELVNLDAELGDQLTLAQKQVDTAREAEDAVELRFAAADEAGTGPADTTRALTTFDAILTQLPSITEERRRLADEGTAIGDEEVALKKKEGDLTGSSANTLALEGALESSEADRESAHRKLEAGAALLTDVREADLKAIEAAKLVEQEESACTAQLTLLKAAENGEEEAKQALGAADTTLENARRAEAAVHASAGVEPGGPCPVCDRTLPDDFHSPTSTGITEAQAARKAAQTRCTKASKALIGAVAAHGKAEGSLRSARNKAQEVVAAQEEAFRLFEAEFGHRGIDADDDMILTVLAEAVRAAEGECEIRKEIAKAARENVTRSETELSEGRKALAQRRRAFSRAENALEKRWTALVQAHDELSSHFRVQGELTEVVAQERRELARLRDEELGEMLTRLAEVRADLREARSEHDKVSARKRTEVERPLARIRQELVLLAEMTGDIATLLALPVAPDHPAEATIAEESMWAKDVLATVETLSRASRSKVDRVVARADAAREESASVLAAAGLADESELEDQLLEATVRKRDADRDLGAARRNKPLCDELDRRIAQTDPVLAGLRDLCGLLTDSKFIHEVVRRRQLALLGIATHKLQSMTNGRFGFHENFLIIDGLTMQSRDVKTLSGGETFLASLALALALVELTAHGGARVEALFLDEGFGSLDSDTLASALDTLTAHADGGRLVAVISHMRAVAVNFDNVLSVKASFNGSTADWLTDDERDALATEHLAGLLS
ncbi:AAA family ATPase [Lentzea flaviverrucosa]|uniref:Nuclease SbcCD subunit C n=1 Tax=Lentzea flaviverrucosa TaxID=200379 RepID=A0A1H9SK68_9PSEU|nr:SMC family ATPase [Lentzea flaviverrucosa]RDI25382.1 exonuclease SbcC [Lentzea flaviverrucosa]SER84649.1 exonuclease SbcC [Lentzea flaviverrucosa]